MYAHDTAHSNYGIELSRAAERSPAAVISEEVERVATSRYGSSLLALILTGSLARGEGTFLDQPGTCRVLGDAEFLLAFPKSSRLPGTRSIAEFKAEVERTLRQRGILLSVGASAVTQAYFRDLPREIFTFELRTFGQVIWGDKQILQLIPKFSTDQISRSDAWHLLCNRILELLEIASENEFPFEKSMQALQYGLCKLYLDMATSFLVFYRAYQPTYRSRAEVLSAIAGQLSGHPAFTAPNQFSDIVNCCTTLKLAGSTPTPWFGFGSAESCLRYAMRTARRLWQWELGQLTNRAEIPDHELVRAWMNLQPLGRRLRGWLSALRRSGVQSIREWPRWMRLAIHSSPRYWIYAAGCELFFQLPPLEIPTAESKCYDAALDRLQSWLPLRQCSGPRRLEPGWRDLASRIASNYHTLLETTRA